MKLTVFSPLAPPMWGAVGRPPPDHSVDNGTGAWGKGPEASSGWGEPDDPGKGSGWSSRSPNPIKSGEFKFKYLFVRCTEKQSDWALKFLGQDTVQQTTIA